MKIRTKTIITIVAAFLLISIASGVTYYYTTANRFRREAEKNLFLLNRSYADRINLKLENYSRVVRDYAAQVLVATYIPDLFRESKRVYPELGQFFYTSLDGKVTDLYPYTKEYVNRDFSGYDFWKQALEKEELVLLLDDENFEEPVLVFSIPILSYFLIESGPVLHGVLSVTLPLDNILSYYRNIQVGLTGSILILDRDAAIRSHSTDPGVEGLSLTEWAGADNVDEILPWLGGGHFGSATFFMENEEYFTSFYPVRANGWTLLLIQTVRELDREMHNTFILIIIVFIISIILAIAVTSRLLYRITKPLKDNLNILKDIAEGKGDFKGLQSISSHDEFEELSGHFQTIFTRMDEVAKDLNVNLRKEKLEKIQIVDELEDSQRRFKAIFNHTYQFMFLINTEGKIVEVNDSLLLFTGDKRYKLINTNFWQTIWWGPEEDTSRIEKTVLRALKGGFVREEFLISGKDGTHTMDFTIKPIRDKHDNSVVMLIAEGRDITDRKKMEKELEDHRNHLKELVEEKTTELKAAQLELIRKSKFATLGKLTAVVSHEIRNPLATIRSSSFVIKRKLKDKDEKIVKVLDRIDRNVHRCDTIIEDLLSYTRETMLEIRIIDLDQWIVSFEEIFSTYKNVTMVYQLQSGAKASLDTERFRRVIINLVENAKQAFDSTTFQSDRKPEITIKTESREECVLIHIMDNGPGIPEENMEKIFEPLFSTKSFGIGLGLPIVMQLIEKHNGILTVDSEEGKGTTFSISLPGRA